MLQKTCSNEQVFSMPLGCFYTKTTCLPQKAMPYFRTFSSRLHNLFRQSDGVLPALFSSVKTVIPFANFGKSSMPIGNPCMTAPLSVKSVLYSIVCEIFWTKERPAQHEQAFCMPIWLLFEFVVGHHI